MKTVQKQNGFSLMEVIVAVFLVGIIVVVIGNLPGAIRLVTSSQSDSVVREVAAKKMEDVRLSGFDNLPIGTTAINDSRLNKLTNVSAFTVVSDCPIEVCTSNEAVKQVKITISWKESGEPKTFQISTLVSQGGLK